MLRMAIELALIVATLQFSLQGFALILIEYQREGEPCDDDE